MSLDLVSLFNKYETDNENQSLLRKSLTSAVGSGSALIPQSLEKEITNTLIRLSPEIALILEANGAKKIAGKYHEFNRLITLPASNSAIGENATTPITQSATERTGVTLKVVRRKGAVTNFLQDTSGDFIDAAAYETENHLTAHVYDMINYILYGNAAANSYEFSGLDYFISTYRTNGVRFGTDFTSLSVLDAMIDKSNRKGGNRHRRAFVMSPEMLSKFSQLLTNVRLNQGLTGGMSQVNVNGGWRLNAYRDIPIIESSNTRPQTTMTSITPGVTASGGSIPDSTTYYFAVAPVTLNGEELAARTSQATATPGNISKISLSWTAFTGAFRYKIYCSTTQYSEKLIAEIPAKTYDANGTPSGDVNSITFSTAPSSANPTFTYTDGSVTVSGLTGTVPTHMQNDLCYEQDTGHAQPETIFLWDLDPIQGLGKLVYTNSSGSMFEGLVTTENLARIDDYLQFMIKSYVALTDSFEATSVMYRNLRVS